MHSLPFAYESRYDHLAIPAAMPLLQNHGLQPSKSVYQLDTGFKSCPDPFLSFFHLVPPSPPLYRAPEVSKEQELLLLGLLGSLGKGGGASLYYQS